MNDSGTMRQHPADCVCDPCWLNYIASLPSRWTYGTVGSTVGRPAAQPIPHGTKYGYNRGCRLDCCRSAMSRAKADHRSRLAAKTPFDQIPHGTVNGYDNYRCRCDQCRHANSTRRVA